MANRTTMNDEVENELLGEVPGYEADVSDTPEPDVAGDEAEEATIESGVAAPEQAEADPNAAMREEQQEVRYDQAGNVIDSRGNVIAPAGRARRLDEQNKRYKGMLEKERQSVTKLRQDIASQNFLNGAPKRLGLSYDETAAALDMMRQFKDNPGQFAQIILAEVAARGVDLNQLLGQNMGNVQTAAIKKMLDERLRPLDERHRREAEVAKTNEAVIERYNSFMTRYPEAEPHQDAIAELMRTEQAADEREGYFMVREFALRNGLDFSQPLGPQVVQRIQQQRGPAARQQQPNGHSPRPMVSGRIPDNNMTQRETRIASPDRSYASIIEEAMQEAGGFAE